LEQSQSHAAEAEPLKLSIGARFFLQGIGPNAKNWTFCEGLFYSFMADVSAGCARPPA
jgi:hypothetical protein